jgi:energy-coupling factor transport system ATP-binding protein
MAETLAGRAIFVEEVTFRYPEQNEEVLRQVSLSVGPGAFVVLCGKTGCGKTTLLRHLKPELAPVGDLSGSITTSGSVGFVMQDPDNQIVTDTVFHELAFGLENQGLPTSIIRRRVAEVASFFGMEGWFDKSTHELSGGQKQMLNLAAVTALQPDIIVLDEPTDQLDPIAAKEFLQMLERTNRELGKTVVLSEHRLEEVLSLCDAVVFMDECRVAHSGDPQDFVDYLNTTDNHFSYGLPEPTQAALLAAPERYPLNVREGRTWLTGVLGETSQQCVGDAYHASRQSLPTDSEETANNRPGELCALRTARPNLSDKATPLAEPVIELHELTFRYSKYEPFILKHLTGTIRAGEVHAIVGGNGSGKSTLFSVIAGVHKPQLGKVKIKPGLRVGALVQNPKATFVCDTVLADLQEHDPSITEEDARVMAEKLGLTPYLYRHPYDLSGGQAQKAALGKILLLDPDILLLDEPTKGLDALAKRELAELLLFLAKLGRTLVVITHDLEFAARFCDVCSLLADGDIIASDTTRAFFNGNAFYTTPINRMTRGLVPGCIIPEDLTTWLATHVPGESDMALRAVSVSPDARSEVG